MPSWYPITRAVRFYKGAYTIDDLLHLPTCITKWALMAESAEAEAERIVAELHKQRQTLR